MILKKIHLKYFRNYIKQSWEPHKGITFIVGNNAQGKTNLIEAIYLGTSSNSFKANRNNDMINWKSNNAELKYNFFSLNKNEKLVVNLNRNGKKTLFLNGHKLTSSKSLPYPTAVCFLPDDMEVVKGNPSKRRKYIDFELGLTDISYRHYLRQYQKALLERNNLLKYRINDNSILEIWTEQLVTNGSFLLIKRLKLLYEIVPIISQIYTQISGGKEKLEIRYLSSIEINHNMDLSDIKNRFYDELKKVKKEELSRKQTIKGPHRDDIVFYINGIEARRYASRGQFKTITLALKIGLLELWKNFYDDYPVFLVDDVLQELDFYRQEILLSILRGKVQAFLTASVESNILKKDYHNDVVSIKSGQIINGGMDHVFTPGGNYNHP